jgi:transposase-like protein
MTNDIVNRLRLSLISDGFASPEETIEAANEIERLREQLDNLKAENQRLSQIAQY